MFLSVFCRHSSMRIWRVSACIHFLCLLALPSGLEKIYELTNTPTQYELRFDLGLGSERVYAVYDDFKIAPVKQKFKLTIGKYSGTAGGPFCLSNLFLNYQRYKRPMLGRQHEQLSELTISIWHFAWKVIEGRRGQWARHGWEYRGCQAPHPSFCRVLRSQIHTNSRWDVCFRKLPFSEL